MAKLSELYPSKYLSAGDLQNKEAVATIVDVSFEEFENDGKKQTKPLCHFQGSEKALVLNKTNALEIGRIAGSDDTDNWKGATVCLYPAMVQFGNKMTESIRIKKPVLAPVAAPPAENQAMQLGATPQNPEDLNDPIPFGPAESLNAG